MGLSWQQGPLSPGAVGRFLVPDPGQAVIPHGVDRGLDPDEVRQHGT
jgi:hypothetical protein